MTMAHGGIDLVYLFVTDMDRAVAFYRDTLRLELGFRAGDDWSQFRVGQVTLGLHATAEGEERRPGGTVAFTVGDLDGAVRSLDELGIEHGPEGGGREGRARFVEFADPDGNVLALFEEQAP
jgi:catechol 2,3-dioxygenase-like lactoylglutathione lyase family enzyme